MKNRSESQRRYKWLASNDGAAALVATTAMRAEGIHDLKIGELLRAQLEPERAAMVLTQVDLRERAAAKFTRASEMLFTRPGLEQSTSEAISRYRTGRFVGSNRIIDLCCGIGGDLISLAALGVPAIAVDRDPVHLFLAGYNSRVYQTDSDITPLLMNVEDAPITALDAVFIDPARRQDSGKRTGYQSEPSVEWSVALGEKAAAVGIKTAPGIPREMVPDGWELELIALGSDLKEAVLWSPNLGEVGRRATVIAEQGVSTLVQTSGDPVPIRNARPGDWLHDVNPAVTNAGLVEDLARTVGADRIDADIGFLVSNGPVRHPMLTSWRVLEVLPWHERRIKQAITALDIGPIDIRRRGLAGDVPAITKRLRGKGSNRVIIAMTRVDNSPTAIICALD